MAKISAIILASGFSNRMGEKDKLTLILDNKPIVAHVLDLTLNMKQFHEIILVARSKEVLSIGKDRGVLCIENEHASLGLSESIKLGIKNAVGDFYFFMPADQPFLRAIDLEKMIDYAQEGRIVSASVKGKPCSPTIFSSTFRMELLSLEGDIGGSVLKRKHAAETILVDIDEQFIVDIDTPSDYFKALYRK